MTKNKISPPRLQPVDCVTEAIRSCLTMTATAAVSLVPGVALLSGPITDLIKLILPTTFETRKEEWCEVITSAVENLKEEMKDIQERIKSEAFRTVFVKASLIAMQNHQQDKLIALRNAVVNNIKGIDIDIDFQLIFLEYIDTLTPSHLNLFKFLCDNKEKISDVESYRELHEQYQLSLGITISNDDFRVLLHKLVQENLIKISPSINDFQDVYEATNIIALREDYEKLPMLRITDVGIKFLQFVLS